jgi:16S rRNA (guanine527-N7)-methyltransferase
VVDSLVTPRFKPVFELLNRYIAEIELFNPSYGLVGAKSREELVTKHILDSLAPLGILLRLLGKTDSASWEKGGPGFAPSWVYVPETMTRIADIGSGAGLPGIPLAICLQDCHFTLVERMGRRAGFLRNAVAVLGLANVTVEEGEMEKSAPSRFKLMVFRAFRPLEASLLKRLFRLLREDGVIAAYKGRRDKTEQELADLGEGLAGEILALSPPFLKEERCLAVLRRPG